MQVVTARRGTLISKSGFKNYDICLNPYVGCQFGCTYCYVRFFIKDKDNDWGEFVRTRDHIRDKLVKELPKYDGMRLVFGTMTDPYQPQERKSRLTSAALEIILKHGKLNKVGIFTRSPFVLDDIDLIKQLPRARVHFTITPFPRSVLTKLEPVPILTERRFKAVRELKEAGIRVHVNVSPILPVWSESFAAEFTGRLAEIGVDEYFVDPMQPYKESFDAVFGAVDDEEGCAEVRSILDDKPSYNEWKTRQSRVWVKEWQKRDNGSTLAIWCDHERKVWVNMRTGEQMDERCYGDDAL